MRNTENLGRVDHNEVPGPSEAYLRRALNLTPAEARLAQGLARGDSLEEISAGIGIKLTTARTQLRAIYDKTGIHRQPKLVAMLLLGERKSPS